MTEPNLAPEPKARQMVLQHSEIVGGHYYELPKYGPLLEVGMKLRLVREPFNPYDGRAVAVYYRSHKLGFNPRRSNMVLANLMDQGAEVKAYIQSIGKASLGGTVMLQLHLCNIERG
jgi:hypothetical protein